MTKNDKKNKFWNLDIECIAIIQYGQDINWLGELATWYPSVSNIEILIYSVCKNYS